MLKPNEIFPWNPDTISCEKPALLCEIMLTGNGEP